jgi:hypothetical protein
VWVVSSHHQHKHLIDFLQTPHHYLRHPPHHLPPVKALLDQFLLLFRDAVAPYGRAAASGAADFLPEMFCATHGVIFISSKVSMNSFGPWPLSAPSVISISASPLDLQRIRTHRPGHFTLGVAICNGHHRAAMSPWLLSLSLCGPCSATLWLCCPCGIEPGIAVGCRFVRLIAATLAHKVVAIASSLPYLLC